MWKLDDFQCKRCNLLGEKLMQSGEIPFCEQCGVVMELVITAVHTDSNAMGYAPTIDPFHPHMTDREAKERARKMGLVPAASADKHHGARNEDHLRLGKLYSGGGLTKRSSYHKSYGAGVGQRI